MGPTVLIVTLIIAAMLGGCATGARYSDDPVERECARESAPGGGGFWGNLIVDAAQDALLYLVEDIAYRKCLQRRRPLSHGLPPALPPDPVEQAPPEGSLSDSPPRQLRKSTDPACDWGMYWDSSRGQCVKIGE